MSRRDEERAYEAPPPWAARLRRLERMRALAEVSGGLLHDLNNLLAAVLGFAEQRLGTAAGSGERASLEGFVQSATTGARLVQRLGALLREAEDAWVALPLEELVEACVQLFRKTAMLEGLAVSFEVDASAPPVCVVRQDAMHALLELMLWCRDQGARETLEIAGYGEEDGGRRFGVVALRCGGAAADLRRLARWTQDVAAGGWSRLAAGDERPEGLAIALACAAMSGARLEVAETDGATHVHLRFPAQE